MQNLGQDISSFRRHVSTETTLGNGNGLGSAASISANARKRTLTTMNVGSGEKRLQHPIHLAQHKAGPGERKGDGKEDDPDQDDRDQLEPDVGQEWDLGSNGSDNGDAKDPSRQEQREELNIQGEEAEAEAPDAKSVANSRRPSVSSTASAAPSNPPRGGGRGGHGGRGRGNPKRTKYNTNYGGQYETDPHHVSSYGSLDQEELKYIRSNGYVSLLYKFCQDMAGSESEHSKRCGHTRRLPVGSMWNLDKGSYEYGNRYNAAIHSPDVALNAENFDKEYENYVTPAAHKAIEDAQFYVKQSRNPNVTDLTLYDLMFIKSLRPAFMGLVLSSMYGSYRPEAYQSVSKIAIGTINANGAYYMEWFQKVVRNVNDEFSVPLPDKNGQGDSSDDILG